MTILHTARLRLEPFALAHLPGLNLLNSDPEVMRYVGGHLETLDDTRALIARVQARWARVGYSWWSFIETGSAEVVGAGCIQNLRRAGSEPDVGCPLEIGWRLRRDRWGQGLATEAAVVMAGFAFDTLQAEVLYAVCEPENLASRAVMQRLGMRFRGLERWYDRDLAACSIGLEEWRQRTAAVSAQSARRPAGGTSSA